MNNNISNKNIRLSKSCIGEKERLAVNKVLLNEFLGMGSTVKEFEDKLTDYFCRPSCCVVNGTAALHLALQAIGIKENDEVLIQSLTYVASIQAITAANAKPIFCDVNKNTLTIDLEDASNKLTDKTKAIIPVHYAGSPGDLEAIYKFAEKNGLRVIEDAAHAFGSKYFDKKVGSFGDIACFSFDGIKNITSGEGGCIVTNDKNVLRKVKDARLLGVEKDTEKRFSGKRSWEFDVTNQGWRYHMSNIMASIGIEQLARFEDFANIRKNLCAIYYSLLKEIDGIKLLEIDYENTIMHIFPIFLKEPQKREKIRNKLLENGIQTGIHYFPNHKLSYFSNIRNTNLPVTEEVYPQLLTLPLHPDLSKEDLHYIVDNLVNIIEK